MDVPSLDYLLALSDDVGIIQHANFDVPNRSTGYCVDDVARGLVVACAAARHRSLREDAIRLGRRYLSFVHDAQLPDGRFRNFMGYDRHWLDDGGGDDANGRAIWALGTTVAGAPLASWSELAARMLEPAMPPVAQMRYVRGLAVAALGLARAYQAGGRRSSAQAAHLAAIGQHLGRALAANERPGWCWFESTMTYDNARLAEAALWIGNVLEDRATLDIGLRTLAFYEQITVENQTFVPIGNQGWYERGGSRTRYAQQPLEAAAMVDAEILAYEITGDRHHLAIAETAHAWFLGRNSRGLAMIDGGGACDGLEIDGRNPNMGAESTLAYLQSALTLARARTQPALVR